MVLASLAGFGGRGYGSPSAGRAQNADGINLDQQIGRSQSPDLYQGRHREVAAKHLPARLPLLHAA